MKILFDTSVLVAAMVEVKVITGGAVYDAVLLHTAQKANVDQIVTLNESDFKRVYPALADKVVSHPQVHK